MKYIIFEDFGGQETPILFPERILHEEMRDQIPYARVLSAGTVVLQGDTFVCSGRAKALDTQARAEDGPIITRHFELDHSSGASS
ncbi:MAG: hypothetical protein KGY41_06570 [Desulfovermiculus sp.]|nr:hypothetical protein [Desulfovermiculus sp.]